VYTGTHDHSTMAGWLASATPEDRELARQDLARAGIDERDPEWALVRLALSSRARIAIIPLQDVLGLGDEARMNAPGTVRAKNWSWRVDKRRLTHELAVRLREATVASRRAPRRALATAAG
jgi:4-alpha-glucanotransferase